MLEQLAVKQAGVEACPEPDRKREPRVSERHDQYCVHGLGCEQRHDGDLDRGADILPRIEPGASTLTSIRPSSPTL